MFGGVEKVAIRSIDLVVIHLSLSHQTRMRTSETCVSTHSDGSVVSTLSAAAAILAVVEETHYQGIIDELVTINPRMRTIPYTSLS